MDSNIEEQKAYLPPPSPPPKDMHAAVNHAKSSLNHCIEMIADILNCSLLDRDIPMIGNGKVDVLGIINELLQESISNRYQLIYTRSYTDNRNSSNALQVLLEVMNTDIEIVTLGFDELFLG